MFQTTNQHGTTWRKFRLNSRFSRKNAKNREENHGTSRKSMNEIHENPRKSMKIHENPWKSMKHEGLSLGKILENQLQLVGSNGKIHEANGAGKINLKMSVHCHGWWKLIYGMILYRWELENPLIVQLSGWDKPFFWMGTANQGISMGKHGKTWRICWCQISVIRQWISRGHA